MYITDLIAFVAYFDNAPVLAIPGRTFDVATYFLEDVVEMVGYVLQPDDYYGKMTEELSILETFRNGKPNSRSNFRCQKARKFELKNFRSD